jgi:seryl-tRNA synthetase
MAKTQASKEAKEAALQKLNDWWKAQRNRGEGLPFHHGRVSVHKLAKAAELRRQVFDAEEGWSELIQRLEEIIVEASLLELNHFQDKESNITASADKKIRQLERELGSVQKQLSEKDAALQDALEEIVRLRKQSAEYGQLKKRLQFLEWEEEVMMDTEGRTFFKD